MYLWLKEIDWCCGNERANQCHLDQGLLCVKRCDYYQGSYVRLQCYLCSTLFTSQ